MPESDPHCPPAGDRLESLLPGCLAGDPGAWADFTASSARLVRAAVGKVVGRGMPGLDPDDLVQDVYIRLVRDDLALLRRFDPGRARLSTWITLVARSVAIDAARRRRLPTTALGDAAAAVTAPEPAAPADPDRMRLGPDVPMHLLSERQRLVVRLLFEDDRSVPETAAILGVDEQTVRSTKHKALTKLRTHYGADAPPASPAPRG
jgi:RNA polymerase sigma factor (sigma-70 family)